MKTAFDLPAWPALAFKSTPLKEASAGCTHRLVVLPAGADWHGAPHANLAEASLKRQDRKADSLAKRPLVHDLPDGGRVSWIRLDAGQEAFAWQTLLRDALKPLLEEHPSRLDLVVDGEGGFRERAVRTAILVALLNALPLPAWKKDPAPRGLEQITVHGCKAIDLAHERAVAEGNRLTRLLARMPPNFLKPAQYRDHLEEFGVDSLEKMGAGAFLAVSRGSPGRDAAIVRLRYPGKPAKAGKKAKTADVALVGKGICFDTGGHNLKPARYMHNMHDDMNGSAVVLGILLAATRLHLPIRIDAWLAIAENHLSPAAYTQNEVVTALNGDTIEVVHTDAEGRMVLADTLTLASREKPGVIIDFATLTGSMAVALGDRMSGVIANRDELAAAAVAAGRACGERVVAFPMPEDYDEALASEVADVKQCTLEGEADHILATRFLHDHPQAGSRPIGYFGASTGAAAALIAAARVAEHDHVGAVVCRGGRPDLAEVWLDGVSAPTLLIAGAADGPVVELNRQALERLHGIKALEIVPGAGHLFEEPGALDVVAASAGAWFSTHLKGSA